MTAPRAAPASGTDLPDEWSADGSVTAFAVRGLVLVVFGGFIGGAVGAALALAAVGVTWRRPVGLVAASAAAMLVAAGFATVFEVTPTTDSLKSNFASLRPLASSLGLAAGVLATVAVVTAAWRERATAPAPIPDSLDHPVPIWAPWRALSLPRTRALLVEFAPYAAVLLVALVIGGILAPAPLPAMVHQLVDNLRNGDGYVIGLSGRFQATGGPSPVPALLGAFGPGGATLALLVMGVAEVGLAMRLTAALAGRSLAVLAGIAVLMVEVATRQQLPAAVASTALLLAAYLGSEERRPTPRAALAGVALAIAVLSSPWTIMGAPMLVAWMGFGRDRQHPGAPDAAAVAFFVGIAVCAPWERYLLDHFHTWAPSTDMSPSLSSVTPFLALAVVAVAAVIGARRNRQPVTPTA